MNIKRSVSVLLPALILATSGLLLQPGNTTYAAKPDKCTPWPECKDDDGGGGGGGEYFGSDGVEFITPSDVEPLKFDYHIKGTPARDTITAGSGADLIEGDDDRDEITALGGDDVIHGDGGSDIIDGGDGNDILHGDAGEDILRGGAGYDELYGDEDDDFLLFSLGGDLYDGGTGFNTINFEDAISVTANLTTGTYTANVDLPTEESGMLWNIESIWGSPGNDVLLGIDNTPNHFFSLEGDNFIQTFGGDDTIVAGSGNDIIYAGAGNDNISAGDGTDFVDAGAGDDTVVGSTSETSNDDLYGGEGCDTFIYNRRFGTPTIMDFNHPNNGPSCDLIHFRYEPYWRADPSDAEVNIVGNDIVIDIWIRRGGGVGGTVILKDAVTWGVSLDISDISFVPE